MQHFPSRGRIVALAGRVSISLKAISGPRLVDRVHREAHGKQNRLDCGSMTAIPYDDRQQRGEIHLENIPAFFFPLFFLCISNGKLLELLLVFVVSLVFSGFTFMCVALSAPCMHIDAGQCSLCLGGEDSQK